MSFNRELQQRKLIKTQEDERAHTNNIQAQSELEAYQSRIRTELINWFHTTQYGQEHVEAVNNEDLIQFLTHIVDTFSRKGKLRVIRNLFTINKSQVKSETSYTIVDENTIEALTEIYVTLNRIRKDRNSERYSIKIITTVHRDALENALGNTEYILPILRMYDGGENQFDSRQVFTSVEELVEFALDDLSNEVSVIAAAAYMLVK